MTLISVDEAMRRLLDPILSLDGEIVALNAAGGRVLAQPITARRTHPPFDASAMDGYAVRAADVDRPGARLRVIGESAAGKRFSGRLAAGQAVRIFTGAPIPEGADGILLQEDAEPVGSDVVAREAVAAGRHVRRAGLDFRQGELLLEAGRLVDPMALALIAAADYTEIAVTRRPVVAILATGDEIVAPGSPRGEDQIVASNSFGVAEIARLAGAKILDLGIVADDRRMLGEAIARAQEADADVLVTLGGASVGDHDLVGPVLREAGVLLDFWKIAMRPGKPLMAGRLGRMQVLGLPGNPVSAMVCGHLFLPPLLARLQGRPFGPRQIKARLGTPLPKNGDRQNYIRAVAVLDATGEWTVRPFEQQDSSMLSTLAQANALVVRPPFAPGAAAGDPVEIVLLARS